MIHSPFPERLGPARRGRGPVCGCIAGGVIAAWLLCGGCDTAQPPAGPAGQTPSAAAVAAASTDRPAASGPAGQPVAGPARDRPEIALDLGDGVLLWCSYIPAGQFVMGSPEDEPGRTPFEGPQRVVTVERGFYLAKHETTQEQFLAVTGRNPSHFHSPPRGGPQHPVEQVTWFDAQEFARRLSQRTGRKVRLPTEAEWEYACRAGSTTHYHFGQTISSHLANFDGDMQTYDGMRPSGTPGPGPFRRGTTPVGSFPPNQWGLHDMHANVWEWVEDAFLPDYPAGPTTARAIGGGPDAPRVVRGGGWFDYGWVCRSAVRLSHSPQHRSYNVGFRIAMDAD